jgi:hypothetical protein
MGKIVSVSFKKADDPFFDNRYRIASVNRPIPPNEVNAMSLSNFLEGNSPDAHGRYLSDIWAFNDQQIERTHNFIQWLFPLSVPSAAVPGAPVLTREDITAIKGSEVAQENICQSANWYAGFLERNDFWRKPYDHNHLRITRVIRSLRLLVDADEADAFRIEVYSLLGDTVATIPPKTRAFWDEA